MTFESPLQLRQTLQVLTAEASDHFPIKNVFPFERVAR